MPILGQQGATGSWWPAGSLAPVQPNAISTLVSLSCWSYGDTGLQGLCDACEHINKNARVTAPVYSISRWWIFQLSVGADDKQKKFHSTVVLIVFIQRAPVSCAVI